MNSLVLGIFIFKNIILHKLDHPKETEERAADPLAGGILNQGHQCGMLWGATLAIGTEAFRRHDDPDQATAVAVTATQHIVESFIKQTNTVNCKEIIGVDLSSVFGLVRFIIRTTLQSSKKNVCFQLADRWAPEAIQAAKEGLQEEVIQLNQKPCSCSSLVVEKMGGSKEEQLMVAGFAGGLGLSGNTCGALSAAIWMKSLEWCKQHPGKNPPYFNNPEAKKLLKTFKKLTGSEDQCDKITGRIFKSIDDHAEFVHNGGCGDLIEALAGNEMDAAD